MADDQVQDIAEQQQRLERARANHLHDLAVEIAAEMRRADPPVEHDLATTPNDIGPGATLEQRLAHDQAEAAEMERLFGDAEADCA